MTTPWMENTPETKEVMDYILADRADAHVVVGPLCWRPSDGLSAKIWYFNVATAGKDTGFRCDQIVVEHGGAAASGHGMRRAFLVALMSRPPIIIHDADDELYMARLCEALWPGERITKLRESVETERAASGPPA